MTTRRELLAGLGGAAFGGWAGGAQADELDLLPRGSNNIVEQFGPIGRFGYILVDVESGKVMDSRNEDELFIPASLSKIPTSFAAMRVHGSAARFATEVKAEGKVTNGVLEGDLHLIGGGDPSLDILDLVELARQVQEAGIYQVTGKFIYYGAALPQSQWLDKTQPWQAPYNPSMGGLNLNYNRIQFRWARQNGYLRVRGAAVSDGKAMPAASVQFRVTRDGPVIHHELARNIETWSLGASILTGSGQRWLPIRRPGLYTASVFQAVCAEIGIILPAPQPARGAPKGKQVAIHRSESVYEMLRGMLKFSTNLTAEALGASAGYASGKKPTSIVQAAGLTTLMTAGAVGPVGGKGWVGFSLENHSGLSVRSRATPRQIAFTLRAAHKRWGDEYLALFNNKSMTPERMGLPIGTLPPHHYILGKTGSMNFVHGLAGYTKIKGRKFAYAFMANEDNSRAILNRNFQPYVDETPSEAHNWSRRTRDFEKAMLKDWVLRYSI